MSTDFINSRPGRPAVEADNEIVAYIQTGLAEGRTISESGRSTLTIYAYCPLTRKLVPVRTMQGKHLEATFRKIERSRVRQTEGPGYTLGLIKHVGGLLNVPVGATNPSTRKAGRPKKDRK